MAVAQAAGIPVVDPVDFEGNFTDEVPPYQGKNVFEANKDIIRDLKAARRRRPPRDLRAQLSALLADRPAADLQGDPVLVREGHRLPRPHGARSTRASPGCPSMSRTASSATGSPTRATGTSAGTAIWGAPIPVWKSDNPEFPRIDVYGSLDEIERDFGVRPKDLHRPYVDELVRPNPDDPTRQVDDAPGRGRARLLVRVGLDAVRAGALPLREQGRGSTGHFPGDFIVEYVGQTRGWFYTLMVLSTALFDKAPFRSAIATASCSTRTSRSSPSASRTIPTRSTVFDTYGADALRWYMISSPLLSGGDLAMPKDGRAIGDTVRQVLLPLWNAYSFFTLYANIDGIRGKLVTSAEAELDRYILGKTAELIARRRGGDGPARHRGGLQCAAALHRGAQQLVHPPLARALLEERRRTPTSRPPTTRSTPCSSRSAGRWRRSCPTSPSTSTVRSSTARACTCRTGRTSRRSPSTQALVERMDLARAVCSAAASIRTAKNLRNRLPLRQLTVAHPRAIELLDAAPRRHRRRGQRQGAWLFAADPLAVRTPRCCRSTRASSASAWPRR